LWDESTSKVIQDQLMARVLRFLSNPNRVKHTRKEFLAMIPVKFAIEFQYIERLQQNIAPDAVRVRAHAL